MRPQAVNHTGVINEVLKGIVDRVTYHNPDNGWSILRVMPFNNPQGQETVIVHQTKVFAGATFFIFANLFRSNFRRSIILSFGNSVDTD